MKKCLKTYFHCFLNKHIKTLVERYPSQWQCLTSMCSLPRRWSQRLKSWQMKTVPALVVLMNWLAVCKTYFFLPITGNTNLTTICFNMAKQTTNHVSPKNGIWRALMWSFGVWWGGKALAVLANGHAFWPNSDARFVLDLFAFCSDALMSLEVFTVHAWYPCMVSRAVNNNGEAVKKTTWCRFWTTMSAALCFKTDSLRWNNPRRWERQDIPRIPSEDINNIENSSKRCGCWCWKGCVSLCDPLCVCVNHWGLMVWPIMVYQCFSYLILSYK